MTRNLETRLSALEERTRRFKPVLVHRSSKESFEDARARYKRLHGAEPPIILTYRRLPSESE